MFHEMEEESGFLAWQPRAGMTIKARAGCGLVILACVALREEEGSTRALPQNEVSVLIDNRHANVLEIRHLFEHAGGALEGYRFGDHGFGIELA